MTLRRRLIVVQVILVAVGLGVFAAVSYSLYRRSTYQRLDGELRAAAPLLAAGLNGGGGGSAACAAGRQASERNLPGPGPGAGHNLPPGSYVELREGNGAVLAAYEVPNYAHGGCLVPQLPASLSAGSDPAGRFFTVDARDGSMSFRALVRSAVSTPWVPPALAQPHAVVITAIPLTDTNRALRNLILLDVSVGVAVLVVLAAGTLLVIRHGLHPLERTAEVARAIATGDLSLRAPRAEESSEVGQLGLAFNTMMARIQGAFAERDATEERLRRFLADASHELRTPLTAIRGLAELYRLGATQDDAATLMARIEENATRMGDLVEELLVLAHLDEARPARREPVDLALVAAEACSDLRAAVAGHRLVLEAPEPVNVLGDAGHLRRAVDNLLANAIHYTPPGTTVELNVAIDKGAALLEIRDHGPGFSEEGLVHAFDRFWRADPTRAGGNGLGLAIVAAVAVEHGGHAWISNAPDGGAVITIRLPIPKPAAAPAGRP